MKKALFLIIILFAAQISNGQKNISHKPQVDAKMPGSALYGDLNVGYSNYGMSGDANLNYRSGSKFVSIGYYKSHLCYKGEYNGIPFPKAGACTHHITIASYSLGAGVLLPGKLRPSISCGISATRFTYAHTEPVRNDFGMASLLAVASGKDYDEGVADSHSKMVIGIPVEFKVHLAPRHTAGVDAGVKVDINREKIFTSVTLGIRVGKIINKQK